MDEWMDGWMDGWIDGWMEKYATVGTNTNINVSSL